MEKIKLDTFTKSKNVIELYKNEYGYDVIWGKTEFKILHASIDDILTNYFISLDIWYPLGAGMTSPTSGGLGEYITKHIKNLTPRHASAIAPIMESEGFIEHRIKGRAVLLRKVTDKI